MRSTKNTKNEIQEDEKTSPYIYLISDMCQILLVAKSPTSGLRALHASQILYKPALGPWQTLRSCCAAVSERGREWFNTDVMSECDTDLFQKPCSNFWLRLITLVSMKVSFPVILIQKWPGNRINIAHFRSHRITPLNHPPNRPPPPFRSKCACKTIDK